MVTIWISKRGSAKIPEALVVTTWAVLIAVARAAFGHPGCDHHFHHHNHHQQQHYHMGSTTVISCFLGPTATPGSVAKMARSESVSPARSDVEPSRQEQLQRRTAQQQSRAAATGVSGESSLARRMLLRRSLSKPKLRTTGGSSSVVAPTRTDSSHRTAADVDNLFRLEVAQRMREMKLMTLSGVGPLAPVAGAAAAAATAASLAEPLPANKLEGDTVALEHQISLLSTRITSIANHLKATPTDAVSRKGLVVLVKRRRRMLQTLRHRDNGRWLAITETLGLRQRPGAPSAASMGAGVAGAETEWRREDEDKAARRERRRDRGRRRRREEGGGRRR